MNADQVTIDFNGYALVGPGATSGDGIHQANTRKNLRVQNGMVSGWSGSGKAACNIDGKNNQIHAVQISSNYYGIWIGDAEIVSECSSSRNSLDGIHAGNNCIISDCSVYTNGGSMPLYPTRFCDTHQSVHAAVAHCLVRLQRRFMRCGYHGTHDDTLAP